MQGRTALSIVRKYYPNVRKIRDAKANVDVQVTANDCKKATAKSPSSCAMAKAFCREYDGAVISLARAYLIDGSTAIRYKVPASVSREIISFDRNSNFAPGEYWLNAPSTDERLGVNGRLRDKKPDARKSHSSKRVYNNHKTIGIRAL